MEERERVYERNNSGEWEIDWFLLEDGQWWFQWWADSVGDAILEFPRRGSPGASSEASSSRESKNLTE